jgi:hypothetical protein
MTNFHPNRGLALIAFASLLCCIGLAQQASGDPASVDAASQPRKISQKIKPNSAPKTYTNADVVASLSPEEAKAASSASDKPSVADSKPASAVPTKKQDVAEGSSKTSILDRPKDTTPDEIIVPAGTEIHVDVEDRKIVNPVRVGFATPIPALSKVALRVDRNYVPYAYLVNGQSYRDYVDYATLTAVTVGDSTYPVQADALPLLKGATNREMIFVLNEPVHILR